MQYAQLCDMNSVITEALFPLNHSMQPSADQWLARIYLLDRGFVKCFPLWLIKTKNVDANLEDSFVSFHISYFGNMDMNEMSGTLAAVCQPWGKKLEVQS